MRWSFVVGACVVLCTSCAGGGERAVELKFGHVGAPGSLFALSAEEFARRANARLPDGFRVTVFGSSQLGGDEVMLQKLKLGTLDFALPSTIMSSTIDMFGLFEMPYLVQDRAHMMRIERDVFWPTLAPLAAAQGYEILAVWENGFRHVTNNIRAIKQPRDLRGIKLRTPRGTWRVKLFQVFGANPTPMPLSEVFVALQTGVMDGEENPLAQIFSSKFQEVQRYLSLTAHVYTPAYVTVGMNRWQRLPEEVRAILEAVARETQSYVYETAERMDAELVDSLRQAGMTINTPDYEAFAAAAQPMYQEFGRVVPGGKDIIDKVVALRDP
jgi:TRAP-type transport system periplasmic protein